jgi:hypothetical protein
VGSGAAAVTFVRNSGQNGTAANFPPDPSAAASGKPSNLAIVTGNLYVKDSTDGGDTFTTINDLSTEAVLLAIQHPTRLTVERACRRRLRR